MVNALLNNTDSYPNLQLEPVASENDVLFSETILGFRLPDILRSFYLNVGNGGNIRGANSENGINATSAQIYGVREGYNYDNHVIHDFYQFLRNEGFHISQFGDQTLYFFRNEVVHGWPVKILPIGLWGGVAGGFSLCLDCNSPNLPVYFFDVAGVNEFNPNFPCPITYIYDSFDAFLSAILTAKQPLKYVEERFSEDMQFVITHISQWNQ
jgi:hypothetical protein